MKTLFFALACLVFVSADAEAKSPFDAKDVVAKYCGYDVLRNYDYSPLSQREAAEVCLQYIVGEPKLFPFMAFAICATEKAENAKKAGVDILSSEFANEQRQECEAYAGGAKAVNAGMAYFQQVKDNTPWAKWPSRIQRTKLQQAMIERVKPSIGPNSSKADWQAAGELDRHVSVFVMSRAMLGNSKLTMAAFSQLDTLTQAVVECVDLNVTSPINEMNARRQFGEIFQTCFLIKSMDASGKSTMEFKALPR